MGFLVHTDLSKIDLHILRDIKYGINPQYRALNYLIDRLKKEDLWFPAYNYDFGKTKIFRPKSDGTSVGAINGTVLTMQNAIRTYTPIFSHVGFGTGLTSKIEAKYEPFSKKSDFQKLLDLDSDIVFFGAPLKSFTFLHYIEQQIQVGYRYKKIINGTLIIDGVFYETSVEFAVRPFGKKFEYNWKKIEDNLKESKIIKTLRNFNSQHMVINMSQVLEFLTQKIVQDPYYLLEDETKEWIKNSIERLGRKLKQEDFEGINK